MRASRDGETVGITLRIPRALYEIYVEITNRANLIDLKQGGRGNKTAQDVMRHRLASLPVVVVRQAKAARKSPSGGEE